MTEHATRLARALHIYAQHGIEPFEVVDLHFIPPEEDGAMPTEVQAHMIDGSIHPIISMDASDGDLFPYLQMACGLSFDQPIYNPDASSFFALYEERRNARIVYLETHTIALARIEEMATEYQRRRTIWSLRSTAKAYKKRVKRHYRQRWHPYVDQVIRRDPSVPVAVTTAVDGHANQLK